MLNRLPRWIGIAALAVACSRGDVAASGERRVQLAGEPAELAGITAAHNAVRTQAGVEPLVWDDGLAAVAQGWADRCIDRRAPRGLLDHDPERGPGGREFGENLYAETGPVDARDAVAAWAAEGADYDRGKNRCARGKVCGHYTQLVWRGSRTIGCAVSHCPHLDYPYTVLCDYAPAGNDGGPPY